MKINNIGVLTSLVSAAIAPMNNDTLVSPRSIIIACIGIAALIGAIIIICTMGKKGNS